MKNYKQILEAVNRGILLALDDFDDEEISTFKKSKLTLDKDYTQDYLDLMNNYGVDLGLPSGTLWCKYNLGCDFDLLNNHPENSMPKDWYGDYYLWGDTNPTEVNFETNTCNPKCNWDSYKYAEKSIVNVTKYCSNYKYGNNGYTDNLTLLLPEDDAAYLNMHLYGFKFRIPTKILFEELIKYTKYEYVKNYKVNGKPIIGLNGRIFKSKSNGNELFIPSAGYCNDSKLYRVGEYCWAWSSSLRLDYPGDAYCLLFDNDKVYQDNYYRRYYGFSVRPILNL